MLLSRRGLIGLPFVLRGSTYLVERRRAAVMRGLRFLIDVARNPVHFEDYATDLMFCFYGLAEATSNEEMRRVCWEVGRERAAYWRGKVPVVPAGAGPVTVSDLVYGCLSADGLGFPNPAMKEELARRAAGMSAVQFLGFDPLREGPPADIPKKCKRCKKWSVRGSRQCFQCKGKLTMMSRYDVFFEAMLTAYFGERYGIRLGASFGDVMRWVPSLRPYVWKGRKLDAAFYSVAYTVTHIVYVSNDYDLRRLRREDFPAEFDFLAGNLRRCIAGKDPETLGEFVDSLLVLGMEESDGLIREGMDYLLAHQNADGSWGDARDRDMYNRYHTTWTGVGALMEYKWG
ncbi:MAG: hypothetical protein JST93_20175 [Acidobacteria bacterium]|nr:hypothetical protein [Acidobacteriota bacterium]